MATILPTAKATWTTIGAGDMSRAHSAAGALGSSPVMGASPVSTLNPLTSEVSSARCCAGAAAMLHLAVLTLLWSALMNTPCNRRERNLLLPQVAEVVAVQPGSFDVNAHFYPVGTCHNEGDVILTAELPERLSCLVWQTHKLALANTGVFCLAQRVLNAQMHPIVRTFLNLGNERIAKRYCHLHPEAVPKHVHEALQKVSVNTP